LKVYNGTRDLWVDFLIIFLILIVSKLAKSCLILLFSNDLGLGFCGYVLPVFGGLTQEYNLINRLG